MAAKGTESKSVETAAHPITAAVEKMVGAMNADPNEQAKAIINRVLTAETIEEIFEESQIASADDVLDIPHFITSVEFQKSTFDNDGGMPLYAVVTGKGVDGATLFYHVGGGTALAQIVRSYESLPLTFALKLKRKATPTAAGYYPLFYVKS
jgi:hypothetical protein